MITDIPNLQHIFKVLPQRYPFLMIDRIISMNKNEIIALKNVTNNEPHFQGHFPDNPIMPGALILEAMFQTSGVLAGYIAKGLTEKYLAYVATVDKVKFRKPVIPGDQLYLKVSAMTKVGSAGRFIGKAYVDDIMVAEATWMSVLAKEPDEE